MDQKKLIYRIKIVLKAINSYGNSLAPHFTVCHNHKTLQEEEVPVIRQ